MSLKYRTSAGTSASNFTDLVVKVGDTLPIGTEVDYDGQSVPAGWQEVDDKSTILYNNSSGSSGSITLSDNASNYEKIEILYGNSNQKYVASLSGTSPRWFLRFTAINDNNAGGEYTREAQYNISDKSVTVAYYWNYVTNGSTWARQFDVTGNQVNIYKVIGFNY
jgi:hypothetical protein